MGIDSQYGFINNSMTYGHHPFSRVGGRNIYKKGTRTLQQGLLGLDIIGPHFIPQVGNKAPCERAPVALTKQRSGHYRQTMRRGNNLGCLYGTVQVAGHDSIYRLCGQPDGHLPSLFQSTFIKLSLSLPLHDLTGIVDGLAMTNKKNFCLHRCKVTK